MNSVYAIFKIISKFENYCRRKNRIKQSLILSTLFRHTCSFWVGSTNFDETKMTFGLGRLEYNKATQNPVLDYIIEVEKLPAR